MQFHLAQVCSRLNTMRSHGNPRSKTVLPNNPCIFLLSLTCGRFYSLLWKQSNIYSLSCSRETHADTKLLYHRHLFSLKLFPQYSVEQKKGVPVLSKILFRQKNGICYSFSSIFFKRSFTCLSCVSRNSSCSFKASFSS